MVVKYMRLIIAKTFSFFFFFLSYIYLILWILHLMNLIY